MSSLCNRPQRHDSGQTSSPDDTAPLQPPYEARPREGRLARSLVPRLERLEGEVTVSLVVAGFGFGVIAGYQLAAWPLSPWWWFF